MIIKMQIIWLLLMMMFPDKFSIVKYLLLCIILCLNIKNGYIRNKFSKGMLIGASFFLIISCIGLLKSVYGEFYFGFKYIDIYFLRPIYVLLFIVNIRKKEDLENLIKGIVNIFLVVSVYDVIYCLGEFHFFPQFMFWEKGAHSITIIENGFLTCRLLNITSFLFGMPIMYMLFFTKYFDDKHYKNKLFVVVFLGTILGMLSGRRVVQVVILGSFLLAAMFVYLKFGFKTSKKKVFSLYFFGAILICGFVVLQNKLDISNIVQTVFLTIKDAFISANTADSPRKLQIEILLKAWQKAPIFGNGLAAFIEGRSGLEYEYQYLAYLMEIGVVGIIVYATIVLNLLTALFNAAKNENRKTYKIYSSILFGFIWFIIAASTNPMIVSTWFWIPVLAFVQVSALESPNKAKEMI